VEILRNKHDNKTNIPIEKVYVALFICERKLVDINDFIDIQREDYLEITENEWNTLQMVKPTQERLEELKEEAWFFQILNFYKDLVVIDNVGDAKTSMLEGSLFYYVQ
jgi:hypothetical protein